MAGGRNTASRTSVDVSYGAPNVMNGRTPVAAMNCSHAIWITAKQAACVAVTVPLPGVVAIQSSEITVTPVPLWRGELGVLPTTSVRMSALGRNGTSAVVSTFPTPPPDTSTRSARIVSPTADATPVALHARTTPLDVEVCDSAEVHRTPKKSFTCGDQPSAPATVTVKYTTAEPSCVPTSASMVTTGRTVDGLGEGDVDKVRDVLSDGAGVGDPVVPNIDMADAVKDGEEDRAADTLAALEVEKLLVTDTVGAAERFGVGVGDGVVEGLSGNAGSAFALHVNE